MRCPQTVRLGGLGAVLVGLLGVWAALGCQPAGEKEQPEEKAGSAVDAPEEAGAAEGTGTASDQQDASDDVVIGPDGQRQVWPALEAEAAPPASERKGEAPWAADLAAKIDAFYKAGGERRRLHLQVDKPLYNPGETIWVRLWDVQAADLSASANAAVTFELLSPQGATVAAHYVKTDKGRADYAFDVGAGAVGGEYTVRARTDDGLTEERPAFVNAFVVPRVQKKLEFVRKAYGPGDEVQADLELRGTDGTPLRDKTVTVSARVDGEELARTEATTGPDGRAMVKSQLPDLIEVGDGLITVMVEDGGVTESISKRIPIILKKVRFDLYPEGGDLVLGLPSRVYFEAKRPIGKPADVEGRVVDDRGEEVTRFASYRDGRGRFELTPQPGRSYRAEITKPEGVAETFLLPDAKAEGCVLRTYDDLDGTLPALRAAVQCKAAQEVAVVATLRGNLLDSAVVDVAPGTPTVVHLKAKDDKLAHAHGVARVTVFDAKKNPVAERVVFRNRRTRLDIDVTPDKASYLPREQVTLTITAKDPSGEPVAADLALSVVDDAVVSYADDKNGNIFTGLMLEPEIEGELEDPNFYFDLTEKRSALAMDLLMGTRGWRTFAWAPVLDPQPAAPESEVVSDASATEVMATGAPVLLEARANADKGGGLAPPDDAPAPPAGAPAAQAAPAIPARAPAIALGGAIAADVDNPEGFGGLGIQGAGRGGGGAAADGFGLGDENLGRIGVGGFGTMGRGGGKGARIGGLGKGKKKARIARVKEGMPAVAGALDKNIIRRVVRKHRREMQFCYEQELLKNANLNGKVVVNWTIDPAGNVSAAQVKSTTMNNQSVEACLAQRVKAWRFPAPQGGGVVVVNYPFIFTPDGGGDAFQAPRSFAPVRLFPAPDYSAAQNPDVRTDFRQTVFWAPMVSTDDKGQATVAFYLSDAVTTFRVFAEGTGAGVVGRQEKTFASVLEFSMAAKIPTEVSATDRIDMPVTLSNEGDAPVSVQLAANFGELIKPDVGAIPAQVEIAAGGSQSLFFPLLVGHGDTVTKARFSASTPTRSDAFERDVTIVPLGYPEAIGMAGLLEESATLNADLSAAVAGTLKASLAFEPSPTASLLQGMEGMLREPTGCFEQTSSSNYPNAMVLSFVRGQGVPHPELEQRATGLLARGYDRLVGYEVSGGGYEWFGQAPAHPALTAYGVLEFTDMKEVWTGVDQVMLDRTTRWLMALRDGKGGFSPPAGRTLHTWSAEPAVANAYIAYALTEAGRGGDLRAEIDAQAAAAAAEQDPYLLALAVLTLSNVPERGGEAKAAAARLAALQGEDGGWTTAKISVVESRGANLHIETTALAMMALMDTGGHDEAVVKGVGFLTSNRSGYGRYGATQATVLALQALTRFAAAAGSGDKDGTVAVLVDGRQVAIQNYSANQGKPLVFEGLEEHLQPGKSTTVELRHQGDRQLPFTLTLDYRTTLPSNSPNAPVHVETTLDKSQVKMGENVQLVAKLRNVSGGPVPMTVARIGFPGGLTTQKWQLEELVDAKTAGFVETRAREVIVYLYGMETDQEISIPLELNATIPGKYTGPATAAYLYYGDTDKHWAPPLVLEVSH